MEFQWPVVRVHAKKRQWSNIEQLMIQKSFFSNAAASFMGGGGGGTLQCAIGFDNMAQILSQNGAPSDVVAKYLMNIKDSHARLQQAGILDCKLAVVYTHIENKDRHSLEMFSSRLAPGSKEMRETVRALEDSRIKWKRS